MKSQIWKLSIFFTAYFAFTLGRFSEHFSGSTAAWVGLVFCTVGFFAAFLAALWAVSPRRAGLGNDEAAN